MSIIDLGIFFLFSVAFHSYNFNSKTHELQLNVQISISSKIR